MDEHTPNAGTWGPGAERQAAHAEPAARGVELEIVRDAAAFRLLGPDWDALLERSAVRTPFMRWDWAELWLAQYGGSFELRVGVLREGGVVAGIAPLVVGRELSGARRFVRHMAFLGGIGPTQAEGLDFIVPAGRETELVPVLCRVLEATAGEWDWLHLAMMDSRSACLPLIRQRIGELGLGVVPSHERRSHSVRLPGSWEALESQWDKDWRSKLRRRWKKACTELGARGLMLTGPEALATVRRLHAARHDSGRSTFLHPLSAAFHEALAARWLPRGLVEIPALELGGQIVAVNYNFACYGRAWAYQSGWDGSHAQVAPGHLVTRVAVEAAIARGLVEFDMLPGDESYKRDWADAARTVVDVEACRPSLVGRAVRFAVLVQRGLAARCRS